MPGFKAVFPIYTPHPIYLVGKCSMLELSKHQICGLGTTMPRLWAERSGPNTGAGGGALHNLEGGVQPLMGK